MRQVDKGQLEQVLEKYQEWLAPGGGDVPAMKDFPCWRNNEIEIEAIFDQGNGRLWALDGSWDGDGEYPSTLIAHWSRLGGDEFELIFIYVEEDMVIHPIWALERGWFRE